MGPPGKSRLQRVASARTAVKDQSPLRGASLVPRYRVQLNFTLSTSRARWRPTLRTLIEGRFRDNRPASARLRFRPGVEYTLPVRIPCRRRKFGTKLHTSRKAKRACPRRTPVIPVFELPWAGPCCPRYTNHEPLSATRTVSQLIS